MVSEFGVTSGKTKSDFCDFNWNRNRDQQSPSLQLVLFFPPPPLGNLLSAGTRGELTLKCFAARQIGQPFCVVSNTFSYGEQRDRTGVRGDGGKRKPTGGDWSRESAVIRPSLPRLRYDSVFAPPAGSLCHPDENHGGAASWTHLQSAACLIWRGGASSGSGPAWPGIGGPAGVASQAKPAGQLGPPR